MPAAKEPVKRAPRLASQKELIVNRLDCAKCLGISPRYLDELIQDKKIEGQKGSGVYDLKIIAPSYISYIKAGTSKDGLTDIRKKLTEKKLEKESISIEIAKGTLHRTEDVKSITANMLAVTRSRLLEIPNKVSHKVMAVSEIDAVKSILQAEIHTALSSLSGYDPAEYFKRSRAFVLLGGEDAEEDQDD